MDQEVITQASSGLSGMTMAVIAGVQLLLLTAVTAWITSRKEKRDAERAIALAEAAAKIKSDEAAAAAKIRSDEKAEDWRRQDEVAERAAKVAERAAEAAALLIKKQEEDTFRQDQVAAQVSKAAAQASSAAALLVKSNADTISRTDEVARLAAESHQRVQAQLISIDEQGHKIHKLVDGDMTLARTNERESMKLLVLALKQVRQLNLKMADPSERRALDGMAEIEAAEKRILELDQIIADRQAAQIIETSEATGLVEKLTTLQDTADGIDAKVDTIDTKLEGKVDTPK